MKNSPFLLFSKHPSFFLDKMMSLFIISLKYLKGYDKKNIEIAFKTSFICCSSNELSDICKQDCNLYYLLIA